MNFPAWAPAIARPEWDALQRADRNGDAEAIDQAAQAWKMVELEWNPACQAPDDHWESHPDLYSW